MKKPVLCITLLFLFLLTIVRTGRTQTAFNTGNVLFNVDAFGAISVLTISSTDTLFQIDRASILVAGNPNEVLDYWNDVGIVNPTTLVNGGPDSSSFEITGTYDNSYNDLPPAVIVAQTIYGWNNEDCALIKFNVTNNEASILPTIVGLDINQDIDSTWENDVIYFNTENNILYNYENTYVGIKILSEATKAVAVFPWYLEYTDNDSGYYAWLTGGINTDTLVTGSLGGVGIMGVESVDLQPQEMRTVYMAIAVGTAEASMLANMAFAEEHYGAITAIAEHVLKSMEYKLAQNFPNPFNPSTTISFSIPRSERITLEVYNLLGQKVASIMNKEMEGGSYNIKFDASNLSSGIYFYTLRAGKLYIDQKNDAPEVVSSVIAANILIAICYAIGAT